MKQEPLIAYHGSDTIKTKYLARVRAHRKADELHKGMTGQNGKGCAVWCTLDKYDHASYGSELGIPQVLARLEDSIFEGLPLAESNEWPERFLSAITPGANLDKVWIQFSRWVMDEVILLIEKTDFKDVLKAVVGVRDLYVRFENGETIAAQTWFGAAHAADAAARAADAAAHAAGYAADAADAARAAGYAAHAAGYAAAHAAGAARAAAHAAAHAAGYAADAADAARAAGYAAAFWVRAANKLEELLKAAV